MSQYYVGLENPDNRTWQTTKKSPSITVSPNGVSNGLSNVTNDGADYGPDTAGTTTSGIQEAINAAAQSVATVKLLNGTFVISTTIVGATGTKLIGESMNGVTVRSADNLNNYMLNFRGCSNVVVKGITFDRNGLNQTIDSSLLSGGQPCVLFDYDSNYVTTRRCSFLNYWGNPLYLYISPTSVPYGYVVEDCLFKGQLTGTPPSGAFVDVLSCSSIYGHASGNTIVQNQLGFSLVIYEAYYYSAYGNHITVNGSGAPVSGLAFASSHGCTMVGNTVQLTSIDQFGLMIQQEYDNSDSTIQENCVFVGNALTVTTSGGANVAITFEGTTSDSLIVGNVFNNFDILLNGDSGTNTLVDFSHNIVQNLHDQILYGSYLPPAGSLRMVGNIGINPQGFSLTTPAVPASGTAQQNTNPYTVRIYLLTSGTGTAFTITDPSGTAKTVTTTLSAGMEWTLDPGASITLTYTTAPTWVWYGV